MDPAVISKWVELVTIPGILLGLIICLYKLMRYIGEKFVSPLGGSDGKIAKFFDNTSKTLEEMPKVVLELKDSINNVNETNKAYLEKLINLNEIHSIKVINMTELLRDVLATKLLVTEILNEIGEKHDLDFKDKLLTVRNVVLKWENKLND